MMSDKITKNLLKKPPVLRHIVNLYTQPDAFHLHFFAVKRGRELSKTIVDGLKMLCICSILKYLFLRKYKYISIKPLPADVIVEIIIRNTKNTFFRDEVAVRCEEPPQKCVCF